MGVFRSPGFTKIPSLLLLMRGAGDNPGGGTVGLGNEGVVPCTFTGGGGNDGLVGLTFGGDILPVAGTDGLPTGGTLGIVLRAVSIRGGFTIGCVTKILST